MANRTRKLGDLFGLEAVRASTGLRRRDRRPGTTGTRLGMEFKSTDTPLRSAPTHRILVEVMSPSGDSVPADNGCLTVEDTTRTNANSGASPFAASSTTFPGFYPRAAQKLPQSDPYFKGPITRRQRESSMLDFVRFPSTLRNRLGISVSLSFRLHDCFGSASVLTMSFLPHISLSKSQG